MRRSLPGDLLLRPLPLAGLLLMAINDHALKPRFPGWWTGKLSDVGVLLYFPALLVSAIAYARWALGLRWRPTRRGVLIAAVFSGLALSAINLSPALAELYVRLLRAIDVVGFAAGYRYVCDPSDLLALVVLPLAVRDGWRALAGHAPSPTLFPAPTSSEGAGA